MAYARYQVELSTTFHLQTDGQTEVVNKSLHVLIYYFRPRQPIYLIPIADHFRASESAFASHMHKLHKEISDRIAQNNANYKLLATIRKRFKIFNVGNFVMVQIRPEWFFSGTVKKLHARSAG